MGSHPSYDLTKDHARGKWYVSPDVWQRDKWAVYNPGGVCIEVCNSKQEALKRMESELVKLKAKQLWDSFNKNQKCGVRFGMFPYAPMNAAEREGYNGRDLAVALMDCAKADGGMRA